MFVDDLPASKLAQRLARSEVSGLVCSASLSGPNQCARDDCVALPSIDRPLVDGLTNIGAVRQQVGQRATPEPLAASRQTVS